MLSGASQPAFQYSRTPTPVTTHHCSLRHDARPLEPSSPCSLLRSLCFHFWVSEQHPRMHLSTFIVPYLLPLIYSFNHLPFAPSLSDLFVDSLNNSQPPRPPRRLLVQLDIVQSIFKSRLRFDGLRPSSLGFDLYYHRGLHRRGYSDRVISNQH
jgi:hypothetical protein